MGEGALMPRGGRDRRRDAPERRCIATGRSRPAEGLLRFVADPEGRVVPDLAGRLPGRGAWLTADRAMVDKAVRKKLFARGLRAPVTAPDDLADLVERLLAARLIERLALARKAGKAVTGFEKTRALVESGGAGLLLGASDGAAEGRAKLARIVPDLPVIGLLDSAELGLAFGRGFAIHAALEKGGGFAKQALFEARRLAGFREIADGGLAGGALRMGWAAAGHEDGQRGAAHGSGQDDE